MLASGQRVRAAIEEASRRLGRNGEEQKKTTTMTTGEKQTEVEWGIKVRKSFTGNLQHQRSVQREGVGGRGGRLPL